MGLIGNRDFIGRPFLPIGSAIVVSADPSLAQFLVCAPTMLLPQPVEETSNAFWAMLAVLRAVDKINAAKPVIHHIVGTAMCCGWGKMDPEVAAAQVRQAYDVWLQTRGTAMAAAYDRLQAQCDVYFHQANMEEQPDIYQNLDFKKPAAHQ